MTIYGKMLAITVPDHWCFVPGIEKANVSVDTWKDMTIPRNGKTYSACLMYKSPGEKNETIPCMYGWEYDDSWFSLTAASQENWVCDKAVYVHTSISMALLFSTFFGVTFFYFGDRFGRRKQYIFCMCLAIIFRGMQPFTASIFPLFVTASAIASAASMPAAESVLAIGIELCGIRHRSANNFRLSLCFAMGTISIILIAWILRNWVYFTLVAAVLCAIPLFFIRYLPESPRWCVAKGHPERALKVLRGVATTNGRVLPDDTLIKLKNLSKQTTGKLSLKTIFLNKILLKNTLLLIWSRFRTYYTYSAVEYQGIWRKSFCSLHWAGSSSYTSHKYVTLCWQQIWKTMFTFVYSANCSYFVIPYHLLNHCIITTMDGNCQYSGGAVLCSSISLIHKLAEPGDTSYMCQTNKCGYGIYAYECCYMCSSIHCFCGSRN
ncbi:solute carrier family 22 member 7-like isoform X2 [Schistocerca americana]|uniref:solute carrier family 22 member 7-like isoform X2 n=1 Tax=Schistocerca americana TaxID=7009 RepID=UPI001F4F6696|nr:solute carrier family 22 member 7-like isoform X2 [Schistocerca americana]